MDPQKFPKLTPQNHHKTSEIDIRYNCIAWAAGVSDKWWEPLRFWPPGVPREYTIDAYRRAYETIGYKVCGGWDFEEGYEKIVIYALGNEPKHAARQVGKGRWTSKMGQNIDIEHNTVHDVAGPFYGQVALIMRRPLSPPPSAQP